MNRKIKFRGISRDTGKWLIGALIPNGEKEAYIAPFGRCLQLEEVNPDTVGQFTGLLDCNGKEIYEGDILEICNPNTLEVNTSVVKWYRRGYWAVAIGNYGEMILGQIDKHLIRISGNIHYTPND